MKWPIRRRNEAPVPPVFPGDFFVLRWDRDRARFFLELDDEDESSYDLGTDPLYVVALLRLRGFERFTREDAVDRAREFGVCQCIPQDLPLGSPSNAERPLRLVQIIPRQPKHASIDVFNPENNNDWLQNLL